jgi:anti-sigma factor RsiW
MVRKPYQVYLDELLSAYLDGELSPSAREELESRLEFDTGLQERLNEMRHMVGLLRSMPQEEVPRNFLLTPAMVAPERGERRSENPLRTLFSGQWTAPVLTFATALSAFVCVAALIANLSLTGIGGLPLALESEPAMQVAVEDAVEEEAMAPEAAADMLEPQEEMGEGEPEDDGGIDFRATDADLATPITETGVLTPMVVLPNVASGGLTATVAPGEGLGAAPPVSATGESPAVSAPGAPPEEIAEIGDTEPAPSPGQDEWEGPSEPPPTAEVFQREPAEIGVTWFVIVALGLLTVGLVIVTVLAWRARGR